VFEKGTTKFKCVTTSGEWSFSITSNDVPKNINSKQYQGYTELEIVRTVTQNQGHYVCNGKDDNGNYFISFATLKVLKRLYECKRYSA